MDGTLVCAVTDGAESDDAVGLAATVSERLRLRLVLAHVVDGITAGGNGAGDESVTMKADREAAERREQAGRGVEHRDAGPGPDRAAAAAARPGRRPDERRTALTSSCTRYAR